ncbi:MAG: hypothetical protein HY711_11035 [Candidatus Melainabacteria bacterium]|nr:hypothetical protein [Candidatus Melainabacteria bacterium]
MDLRANDKGQVHAGSYRLCAKHIRDSQVNAAPYLSIVATARNDNHGGNMLGRMQIFLNGLLEQCRRHQLSAEIIIVDWNPPQDRPRLVEELSWQHQGPSEVRFIEVPQSIHSRLQHADVLPLFQMIAKNVGIRRARGQFVLATNIDLMFSNELIAFLASRSLQEGCIYRIDRHDVQSDVPMDASIDEQLAYCHQSIIRVHTTDGIRKVAAHSEKADPGSIRSISLLAALRKIARVIMPLPLRNAALRCLPESSVLKLHHLGLLNILPQHGSFPHNQAPPYGGLNGDKLNGAIHELPSIHINACGDFTLMARTDWFTLRAYPEFEMYSLLLDSLLCLTGYHAGLHEIVLEDPMRMYHIEHGGGWTPETEDFLKCRLEALAVPQMTSTKLLEFDRQMQLNCMPTLFNGEGWGYAGEEFVETKAPIRLFLST